MLDCCTANIRFMFLAVTKGKQRTTTAIHLNSSIPGWLCFVPVIWALCATAGPAPASRDGGQGFSSRFTSRQVFSKYVRQGRESPFGLDYVFVHSPGARDQKLVDNFCETVAVR